MRGTLILNVKIMLLKIFCLFICHLFLYLPNAVQLCRMIVPVLTLTLSSWVRSYLNVNKIAALSMRHSGFLKQGMKPVTWAFIFKLTVFML